ncbi:MAG: type II 3-dehydroquinate dehydratase [Leucobacter sp.]
MDKRILLVNGPNLNLLGTREPEIYGYSTLADIEALVREVAAEYDIGVSSIQSNHEGELIDAIHEAREDCDAILINPAAFTHTSVALLDALSGVELPVGEVHISNVHAREPFRHHSYVSSVAEFVIAGCGVQGYEFGVRRLAAMLAD